MPYHPALPSIISVATLCQPTLHYATPPSKGVYVAGNHKIIQPVLLARDQLARGLLEVTDVALQGIVHIVNSIIERRLQTQVLLAKNKRS